MVARICRNPAEFWLWRLFAFELRRRGYAARGWVLPGSSASVLHGRWPSCGIAEKARIGRDLFRSEDDPAAAKPATPLLSLRWTFRAKRACVVSTDAEPDRLAPLTPPAPMGLRGGRVGAGKPGGRAGFAGCGRQGFRRCHGWAGWGARGGPSKNPAGIEAEIAHLRSLALDALGRHWRVPFGRTPPAELSKDLLGRMPAYPLQERPSAGLDRQSLRPFHGLARPGD